MSLTLQEAALVMAKINTHHGNARLDKLSVESFHEELRADVTLAECMEAVKRFYADNSTGRWCGSGDINGIVRKLRNGAKPSEAQIGRECERLGLVEDQAWLYRRQRMMGRSPDESRQVALAARDPLRLPPAKPKRRREGGGFNPGLGVALDEVLATRRPAES